MSYQDANNDSLALKKEIIISMNYDILGLCEKYSPKFVKRYADVSGMIRQGIDDYIREVKDGSFPGPEHSF